MKQNWNVLIQMNSHGSNLVAGSSVEPKDPQFKITLRNN